MITPKRTKYSRQTYTRAWSLLEAWASSADGLAGVHVDPNKVIAFALDLAEMFEDGVRARVTTASTPSTEGASASSAQPSA